MHIRPLTPDDQAFLWQALYHAIYVAPGEPAPDAEIVRRPELARYVAAWMQRPDDLGFGVVEDGRLVGAAWLRRWQGEQRGYGYVDEDTPELSVALLPAYRGRGLGTQLLGRLFAAAQERFAAVSLSVTRTNPARRLYERHGFEPIGELQGETLMMIRRFTPGENTLSNRP